MILVCVLLLILVLLIIGYVIPPAYYLGMYHDEFQQRFVGIYDWNNGNGGEIRWDVSDSSKNPRILGIMVYDKHNNIIVDN